jgi:hypothetical protein
MPGCWSRTDDRRQTLGETMRWFLVLALAASAFVTLDARAEDGAIEIVVAEGRCAVSAGPTGDYPIYFIKSASDRTQAPAKHVRVNGTETATVLLGSIATKFQVKFDSDTKHDVEVTCDAPPKTPTVTPAPAIATPSTPPPFAPLAVPMPPPFPRSPDAEPMHHGPPLDDAADEREAEEAAIHWLTDEHFRGLHKTPGHFEENGVWTLYHLPDGRPAFPLPIHITEHQRVRLRVVVPEGAGARFNIDSCAAVPSFRSEGPFKSASAPQHKREPANGERKFVIVDYPQELSCTKTLTYSVQVKDHGVVAETKTSISIDSVQRFFVGAGLEFDFAAPQKLSLNDRAVAGGGSEKYIELAHHFAGFRPLITAGVYPCVANPHDWKVCNMFAPVIAIDPTRIDQGAGLGLQFSPIHGLGIVGGADVYLSEKIPDEVHAKPGQTWTVPGDLPVDKRFDAESFGGFLAVTVTLDLLTSVFQ